MQENSKAVKAGKNRITEQLSSHGKDLLMMILLFSAALVLLLSLHALTGKSFAGPSYYNTYTRQAMAWREGALHLPEDVPALELAVYEGEYYVSFPPVPSLIELPLTFLFDMDTPDNLLMTIYIIVSLECLYLTLRKSGMRYVSSAAYAFMTCFCSCLLPLLMEGAVWYHAQVLAFMCITVSLFFFTFNHPAWGCVFYALSVGCRPFDVIYGPVLILLYLHRRKKEGWTVKRICRNMLPGIVFGLLIAAAYGAYNFVRFGNPLEFGHNYLPEFSFQGGVQFSIRHVANNAQTFIFGMPFKMDGNALILNQFGFSFMLATPMLTIMMIFMIIDAFKREFYLNKAIIGAAFFLHLFVLLLHRTFGGYQFGARYTCDLLPYAMIYLTQRKKQITGAEITIGCFALIFSIYGTMVIHL